MSGKRRKLQLDEEPFVKQRAVVCRGTAVFRTTDHNNVVKFSWTSDKRPLEADHLRLAYEKGFEGIARFVGYQSITSIADLRRGLTFDRPWTIRGATGTELTSSRSLISQSSSFACIKPLCSGLRRMLFPFSAQGKLLVGTPPE